MQKHRFITLGLVVLAASLSAAGCSDDDEKLLSRGDDSGGTTGAGGQSTASGGVTAAGGVTTPAGGTQSGTQSQAGSQSVGGTSTAPGGAAGSNPGGSAGSTQSSTPGAGKSSTGGANATGGVSFGGGASGFGGVGEAGSAGLAGAPPIEVPPGVAILKYVFEDGSGTAVTDTTGNGHNGSLSGAAWTLATEGRNAMGVGFATADAAVALPANLFGSAAGMTVSAWVMLTANEPGNRLFDFGSGLGNHIYLTFNNLSGGIELGMQVNDGSPQTLYTATMLPLNVWKHVTATIAANGAHLYVDGWEVARSTTFTLPPSALGATPNNWIGKSLGPDPAFAGRIDEFYVYDNPVSAADIRQLAWPKTDYSIWHFDESDGTVAVDSSDFHRDATLVRATIDVGVKGNSVKLYNPNDTDTVPPDDQYVQLPEGVVKDCTQGLTVATWINLTGVRAHARIFEFSNDTSTWVFGRAMGGMTQQFAFGNFTDGAPTTTDPNYASIDYAWHLGSWHHVAAVRDGQIVHAYIDGIESGPKTMRVLADTIPPVSSLGSTLYNYIGRTKDSAASHERRRFHGKVDEFLLTCRPYTLDEIKMLATRFQ